MNKKGEDWQAAVDAVLAGYTNRMNLACGDNMQLNTVSHGTSNEPSALQTAAALAIGMAFPPVEQRIENPYDNQSVWMDVTSMSEVYDYNTAYQVVMAGLSNSSLTQNAFLTSAQMDNMKTAYTRGTKVIILRDSTRCFVVPIAQLTQAEQSLVAQSFANCINK